MLINSLGFPNEFVSTATSQTTSQPINQPTNVFIGWMKQVCMWRNMGHSLHYSMSWASMRCDAMGLHRFRIAYTNPCYSHISILYFHIFTTDLSNMFDCHHSIRSHPFKWYSMGEQVFICCTSFCLILDCHLFAVYQVLSKWQIF